MTTPPRWPFADFGDAAFAGAITGFDGEHRFLSNFVGTVEMYGIPFRSLEAAFVAAKFATPPEGVARHWLVEVARKMPHLSGLKGEALEAHLVRTCAQAGVEMPGPDDTRRALHIAQRLVAQIPTPGAAKKLGRQIALRPDWEEERPDGLLVKEWVLLTLNRRKYAPGSRLTQQLLATDARLILEGNAWGDMTWGVIESRGGVVGWNRMGAIAMAVREERGGAGVPDTASPHMPRFAGRGL